MHLLLCCSCSKFDELYLLKVDETVPVDGAVLVCSAMALEIVEEAALQVDGWQLVPGLRAGMRSAELGLSKIRLSDSIVKGSTLPLQRLNEVVCCVFWAGGGVRM